MYSSEALQTVRARIGLVFALALALVVGVAASASADSVTDLGVNFVPMGLNGSGQVVGDQTDNNVDYAHAALWNGSLQQLGQLNSTDDSDAYAISAGGRISGDDYAGENVHGVYWNGGGTANQVGPFSGGSDTADYTVLNDVDTAGDVVGFTPDGGLVDGFLYHAGTETVVGQTDLGGQPGGTVVGAITPDGSQMLGSVNTSSGNTYYLWSSANPSGPGTALNLTPPTNGAGFFAGVEWGTQIQNDLASDGTVIGYMGSGNSKTYYIRYPNGTETEIGQGTSGLHLANAVNASHVVAGAIYGPSTNDPLHAAIWANGKVTDLNTLLPPGTTGWDLIEATAINDNGDIAGIAAHNGQSVGFLLNTGASASVTFGTIPQLQVGKIVDVPVTVTAGAVDLSSVSLGDGLSVSGDHAKVDAQAPDIDGFSLGAGQSKTFTFKLKGVSEGDAGLSISLTGTSARGNVTDSATTTAHVWDPKLTVLHVKAPSAEAPGDTLDLEYRGLGWDPTGGQIGLRFSGEDAGDKDQGSMFDGTLKITRWPKRITDERAITDHAGGGYCWGELAATQGDLYARTKVQGKWQGWVLWSANPDIKAHEAWCEGEEYTFLSKSAQPIVVMGDFPEGRRFGLGLKVYGASGPGTASNDLIIHPGHILSYYDRSRDVCVGVSLDHNGDLITTATRGACS
ncbi:MAG TPA: hypothetical protein VMD48_08120 [Solirubrobacteraceae bacterium]|nr:hypothetical protein [Solirubrobacteraceae bacterium]